MLKNAIKITPLDVSLPSKNQNTNKLKKKKKKKPIWAPPSQGLCADNKTLVPSTNWHSFKNRAKTNSRSKATSAGNDGNGELKLPYRIFQTPFRQGDIPGIYAVTVFSNMSGICRSVHEIEQAGTNFLDLLFSSGQVNTASQNLMTKGERTENMVHQFPFLRLETVRT